MTSNTPPRNTLAIVIFICYLSVCATLCSLILYDLWLRHKTSTPHPSDSSLTAIFTFPIRPHRLIVFLVLTFSSIALTWYYMISFFSLSYRVWAHTHAAELGLNIYDGVHMGPWLQDVELFRQAWEIVLETPQRLVWSQPIFFISAAWSVFLGLEAQKYGIRYSWAYMLLGQLVAICFAQNLFYLAIFLSPATPSSSPGTHAASHRTCTPCRSFYGIPLLVTAISVAMIPYVVNTPNFLTVLYIPHICLLLPPLLHNSLPSRWMVEHEDSRAAGDYYGMVFKGIFTLGLVLQVKTMVAALRDDSPAKHLHRHSVLYHGGGSEGESAWGAIWQGFSDHPAVSSVGWDTVICILSFSAWVSMQKVAVGKFFGFKDNGIRDVKVD